MAEKHTSNWTPLLKPDAKIDTEYEQRLADYLANGGDPNAKNGDGTILQHVLSNRSYRVNENLKLVASILKQGADPKIPDNQGTTPLHWAARNDRIGTMKLLIEKGADTNAINAADESPLSWGAAGGGNVEVMKLLMDNGADTKAPDKRGATPLHLVAGIGNGKGVKLLIEKGADPNAADKQGTTALHWAAGIGSVDAMKSLIEKGADLKAQDKKDSRTPLHWAADNGRVEAMKLLIKNGADIDIKDSYGRTPLQALEKRLTPDEFNKVKDEIKKSVLDKLRSATTEDQRGSGFKALAAIGTAANKQVPQSGRENSGDDPKSGLDSVVRGPNVSGPNPVPRR